MMQFNLGQFSAQPKFNIQPLSMPQMRPLQTQSHLGSAVQTTQVNPVTTVTTVTSTAALGSFSVSRPVGGRLSLQQSPVLKTSSVIPTTGSEKYDSPNAIKETPIPSVGSSNGEVVDAKTVPIPNPNVRRRESGIPQPKPVSRHKSSVSTAAPSSAGASSNAPNPNSFAFYPEMSDECSEMNLQSGSSKGSTQISKEARKSGTSTATTAKTVSADQVQTDKATRTGSTGTKPRQQILPSTVRSTSYVHAASIPHHTAQTKQRPSPKDRHSVSGVIINAEQISAAAAPATDSVVPSGERNVQSTHLQSTQQYLQAKTASPGLNQRTSESSQPTQPGPPMMGNFMSQRFNQRASFSGSFPSSGSHSVGVMNSAVISTGGTASNGDTGAIFPAAPTHVQSVQHVQATSQAEVASQMQSQAQIPQGQFIQTLQGQVIQISPSQMLAGNTQPPQSGSTGRHRVIADDGTVVCELEAGKIIVLEGNHVDSNRAEELGGTTSIPQGRATIHSTGSPYKELTSTGRAVASGRASVSGVRGEKQTEKFVQSQSWKSGDYDEKSKPKTTRKKNVVYTLEGPVNAGGTLLRDVDDSLPQMQVRSPRRSTIHHVRQVSQSMDLGKPGEKNHDFLRSHDFGRKQELSRLAEGESANVDGSQSTHSTDNNDKMEETIHKLEAQVKSLKNDLAVSNRSYKQLEKKEFETKRHLQEAREQIANFKLDAKKHEHEMDELRKDFEKKKKEYEQMQLKAKQEHFGKVSASQQVKELQKKLDLVKREPRQDEKAIQNQLGKVQEQLAMFSHQLNMTQSEDVPLKHSEVTMEKKFRVSAPAYPNMNLSTSETDGPTVADEGPSYDTAAEDTAQSEEPIDPSTPRRSAPPSLLVQPTAVARESIGGFGAQSNTGMQAKVDREQIKQNNGQMKQDMFAGVSIRALSEIKALKKPPEPIKVLMEVCCLLMKIEPHKKFEAGSNGKWTWDYWEPARKSILCDPFFLSKLRTLSSEYLPEDLLLKIREEYLEKPSFTEEKVANCCRAARPLFQFIVALSNGELCA